MHGSSSSNLNGKHFCFSTPPTAWNSISFSRAAGKLQEGVLAWPPGCSEPTQDLRGLVSSPHPPYFLGHEFTQGQPGSEGERCETRALRSPLGTLVPLSQPRAALPVTRELVISESLVHLHLGQDNLVHLHLGRGQQGATPNMGNQQVLGLRNRQKVPECLIPEVDWSRKIPDGCQSPQGL